MFPVSGFKLYVKAEHGSVSEEVPMAAYPTGKVSVKKSDSGTYNDRGCPNGEMVGLEENDDVRRRPLEALRLRQCGERRRKKLSTLTRSGLLSCTFLSCGGTGRLLFWSRHLSCTYPKLWDPHWGGLG